MSDRKRAQTGTQMHAFSIFGRIYPYRRSLRMLSSLHRFQHSEVAQQRLKIIQFYEKHGEQATIEAFGANRKVIWHWKRQLERAHGELAALIPQSTRPKHTRQLQIDPRIVAFIQQLREAHPRLGKEKIKPLLDAYCRQAGLQPIAVSTIGKILQRKQLFHQPRPGGAKKSRKPGKKRARVRYAVQPTEWGHLHLDTLERVVDGLKLYFYSGIDVRGKFAFSLPYRRRDSANTVDFFGKLRQVYPLAAIASVQNDNGSEFLGEFEGYLEQQGIPQHFTYPRCPKINGCVERYQRTLAEEFIQVHEEVVRSPVAFQQQLANYLVFYNCERAHASLNYQSPVQHLLAEGLMSKKSMTHTFVCLTRAPLLKFWKVTRSSRTSPQSEQMEQTALKSAGPSRLNIKSEVTNLGLVADFIAQAAQQAGLDDRETYKVQMAVDEAVTNIIQHAYKGDREGRIDICCQRRGQDFIVDIRDFGKPFDPSRVRTPRVQGPLSRRTIGGLGLFFMKKLMDQVEFTSDAVHGNRVRMVKRIK